MVAIAGQGQDILVAVESITGTDRSDTIAWDDALSTTGTGLSLSGLRGADVLTTSRGGDTLDGGIGADTMTGGAGNDIYVVDQAGDVIVEQVGEGNDQVVSGIDFTLTDVLENLVLTGNAVVGTGSAFQNEIVGNDGDNLLLGLDGRDTLTGGLGQDTLDAGLADGDSDRFRFASVEESAAGAADLIRNFEVGRDDIEANALVAGSQRFSFIDRATFSGTAGELRIDDDGTNTFILGDTDGDRVADFVVELEGVLAVTTADLFL